MLLTGRKIARCDCARQGFEGGARERVQGDGMGEFRKQIYAQRYREGNRRGAVSNLP